MHPKVTPAGTAIMLALLVATIIAAAVPMVVGIAVVAVVPWIGELRHQDATWVLLHLLWMYPALWLFTFASSAIARAVLRGRPLGSVGRVVERVTTWAVIAVMYSVIFDDVLGYAVAALITCVLWGPAVRWLRRRTPGDPCDAMAED